MLWCLLLALLAASSATVIDQGECPHPWFPQDLSTAGFLGFDSDLNLHGQYRFDFGASSHTTYFSVGEESLLRVYVHSSLYNVVLTLYPNNRTEPSLTTAGGINVDQSMQLLLEPQGYRLVFQFEGTSQGGCDTITTAFAVSRKSSVASRVSSSDAATCGDQLTSFPQVALKNFAGTPQWTVAYDSEATNTSLFFKTFQQGVNVRSVRFLYALNFTVPTMHTPSNTLWRVTAQLGFDFVSSGSLGLLLDSGGSASPNLACISSNNCNQGIMRLPNRKVIDVQLSSGDYRIWIFDNGAERLSDRSLSPMCTPFTFKMDATHIYEEEDFLSCEASLLPRTFDAPGYLTRDGRLEVHGRFLAEAALPVHNISFTREADIEVSLFRLKLGENSHVDLDVRLIDPNGVTVALSRLPRPKEENIVAQLSLPGRYTVEISKWGSFALDNCETFDLFVRIAPVSFATDYCSGITADAPLVVGDPSDDLNLSNDHTFNFGTLARSPVVYMDRSALSWQLPFEVQQVVSDAKIRVRLGQDFLLGHLLLTLMRSGDSQPIVATQQPSSFLEISEFLEPGFYTLSIEPGSTQLGANTTLFPSCVKFSFELNITSEKANDDPLALAECWQWPEIPTSLEQPQFLDNPSRQTYVSGTFLFPPGEYVQRRITFDAGPGNHIVRAYVDPHPDRRIDLDLMLLENGRTVAYSMHGSGLADQVVYRLKEKSEYTLQVHMFRIGDGDSTCDSFGFEVAVEPVPTDLWSGPCQIPSLPAANLIPTDPQRWPWDQNRWYHFTQSPNVSVSFEMNIDLTEPAFLRVAASYEFIWGAFALSLADADGNILHMGTGGENTNNLGTLRLEQGSYKLLIEHSSIPPAEGDQPSSIASSTRCSNFFMHFAIDAAPESDSDGPVEHECLHYPLPASFTSPASAHPLSGNYMQFSRDVLMLTDSPHRDQASFTLSEPMLFRVYVPELEQYDVDIVLQKGSTRIFHATNRGENSRVRKLEAGDYVFETRYYQQLGADPLPRTRECVVFPLQVELLPIADVIASPAHATGDSCTGEGDPLGPLTPSMEPVQNTYGHVETADGAFHVPLSLVLTSTSVLSFTVDAEFGTNQMFFQLTRVGDVGVTPLFPVMGESSASFYGELSPGNWTIDLFRPRGDDSQPPPSEIKCTQYTITYQLIGDVAPSECSLQTLPDTLPPPSGGAVSLYGEKFRAPAKRRKHYITFNVTTSTKIMRVWLESGSDTRLDLDLYLYNDTSSMNSSSFVGSSAYSGLTEDFSAKLAPQTGSYVLVIYTYSVHHSTTFDCPEFLLAIQLEDLLTVEIERLCPASIPSEMAALPPSTFTVGPNSPNTLLERQAFALTRDVMEPDLTNQSYWYDTASRSPRNVDDVWKFWRHIIAFEVREESTVRVELSSNFLAMNMLTYDGRNTPGASMVLPGSLHEENFVSTLERVYTPGFHSIALQANLQPAIWGPEEADFNNMCLQFSLEITSKMTSGLSAPQIEDIFPSDAKEFNPRNNLYVTVMLDHILDQPAAEGFEEAIFAGPLVYLTASQNPTVKIIPQDATLENSRTRFYVVFSKDHLQHSENYTLHLDVSAFKSNGAAFSLGEGVALPTFRMQDCTCSGHGHCDAMGDCVCDSGYRGVDCSGCAVGFHAAGSSCVPDVQCTPTFCNGHGNCSNAQHGVPQCTCFPGYVSVGESPCSDCASGYSGYPKCVPDAEEGSDSTCGLSLLPPNLNGPGYLEFDDTVHLSGRYYLDMLAKRHTMLFTLKVESVVRVYVAPHAADVDLALRRDFGNGQLSNTDLAGSYNYGGEENVFIVLPPGDYGVIFFYFQAWSGDFGPCENAKVELVIKPKSLVTSANNNLQDKCANAASHVLFDGSVFNVTMPSLTEGTDMVYRPLETMFGVPAVDPNPPASGPRVIASRVFRAPVIQGSNQRVELEATVAYRFETGDLGLILQEGYNAGRPLHCDLTKDDCLHGTNGYNSNSIRSFLQPGKYYTLFLYEPVSQNTDLSVCSLYQFSLELHWRPAPTSDLLGCPGSRLPGNLLVQLDSGLHWEQTLALSPVPQNTTISVGVGGVDLRLSMNLNSKGPQAQVEGVDIDVYRYGQSGALVSTFASKGHPIGSVVVSLGPGTYVLVLELNQLLVDPGEESVRCRYVDVELETVPSASVRTVPTALELGCPASADKLPVTPPVPIGTGAQPFHLPWTDAQGSLITYYSFSSTNGAFLTIPIMIEETSFLVAEAWSMFMPSQIVLQVFERDAVTPLLTSSVRMNAAKLSAVRLDQGTYSLQLAFLKPDEDWPCRPFHFSMRLETEYAVSTSNPDSDPELSSIMCESIVNDGVEQIPPAFDSWRFKTWKSVGTQQIGALYTAVNFHTDKLLLPQQLRTHRSWSKQTRFTVSVPSIVRSALENGSARSTLLFADNNTEIESTYSGGSMTHTVVPGVNYAFNWTFYNYAADPVVADGEAPWCHLMGMHVTIQPVAWGLSDDAKCSNGGGSKFPALSDLPGQGVPSKISPFTGGGKTTYYVQQKDHLFAPDSVNLNFRLDAPSNVRIEVDYDMAFLHMELHLRNIKTYERFNAAMGPTGLTLWATGIPAGPYQLFLAELVHTLADDSSVRCRPFSFTIWVEKDVAAEASSHGFLPIPDTLNDVAHLDYDGTVHFSHEYLLKNVNLQDTSIISEKTNVSVVAASVMKIGMRMHDSSDESAVVPVVRVYDVTADSSRLFVGAPSLLLDYALVVGHEYRIGWSAKQLFADGLLPSSDVRVVVELSIQPTQMLGNLIHLNHDYSNTAACTAPLVLPKITPDISNGAFLFANDALVLPASGVDRHGVIAFTDFEVDEDSVFYVVLENQFALSHLSMELVSRNVSDGIRFSMSDRNRQILHEQLPAGNYTLQLVQRWDNGTPDIATPAALKHCLVLSLHISLRMAWQGSASHLADCTNFNLLPANLSNAEPYGRPIDAQTGELIVYGERFLYPQKNDASSSFSFMQLALPPVPSLQVLLFFQVNYPVSASGEYSADFMMLGYDETDAIFDAPSYGDQGSPAFRLGRFRIEEALGAVVELEFRENLAQQQVGTCPYFTFAAYTLDTHHLANTLVCTAHQKTNMNTSPSPSPTLSSAGTFYEHSYGSFSTRTTRESIFEVRVVVTETSILRYAMSTNAFVSSVSATFGTESRQWDSGVTSVLPYFEDHGVNARIVGTEFMGPGTYTLKLTHASLAPAGGLTNANGETVTGEGLCLPWSADIWVTPWFSDVGSYIVGVVPAQMWSLRPNVNLDIRLSAEDAVLGPTQEPVTKEDMLAAFVLQPSGGGSPLAPDAVLDTVTADGAELRWRAGRFSLGETYTLVMRPGHLLNPSMDPLMLFSNHTYKVVAPDFCGAHGHFNDDYMCVCDAGYGGADCSVCGVGYVSGSGGKCVESTHMVCQPDSCGMDAQNRPLGICSDAGGHITCDCIPTYTGDRCQLCKDSSQQGHYPVCAPDAPGCPMPCENDGLCDEQLGTCKCQHHWQGPTCGECPEKYGGSDCDRCRWGLWGDDCHPITDDMPWWGKFAIAGVVLLVIVGIVIVIMACYRWRKKRNARNQSYMMSNLGSYADSSGDEFFDDNIHQSEPGLLSDQFNLHLSDDEDF